MVMYLDDEGMQLHISKKWASATLLTELNRASRVWHKHFSTQASEVHGGAIVLVCSSCEAVHVTSAAVVQLSASGGASK